MGGSVKFAFDNSYARELQGLYVPWQGARVPQARIVQFNTALARELGLDAQALNSDAGAAVLAGSRKPDGAAPLAQVYAGHQFGGFSPRLGDGRAILLGEVIDRHGARRDIHLKGAGRTPFARGGDGKAVLGPVLREYLIGEAMHALGIPTTRGLAALTTGEQIARHGLKAGAVLARVAASHLRVGTFQYFAARGEWDKLKRLADYAIARHDSDLIDRPDKYTAFLSRVVDRQAALIARWLQVGFVHGVMNTDNMTISGETIDYGPCAFLDVYDPKAIFSSIDRHGRYSFANQPAVALWNLARLAETLLVVIDADDDARAVRLATDAIDRFGACYEKAWTRGMGAKIGLAAPRASDAAFIDALFAAMAGQGVDFTLFFCRLADAVAGDDDGVTALFADPAPIEAWLLTWRARLREEPRDALARAEAMKRVNPLYIARNHQVEKALQAAEANNDFAPFRRLLEVLADPFTRRAGLEEYEAPAPGDFGPYVTYCGT